MSAVAASHWFCSPPSTHGLVDPVDDGGNDLRWRWRVGVEQTMASTGEDDVTELAPLGAELVEHLHALRHRDRSVVGAKQPQARRTLLGEERFRVEAGWSVV